MWVITDEVSSHMFTSPVSLALSFAPGAVPKELKTRCFSLAVAAAHLLVVKAGAEVREGIRRAAKVPNVFVNDDPRDFISFRKHFLFFSYDCFLFLSPSFFFC